MTKLKLSKILKNETGSGLVLSLMVLLVLSVLGASLGVVTIGSHKLADTTRDSSSAYYIAEAGANMAYEDIKYFILEAHEEKKESATLYFEAIEGKMWDGERSYIEFEDTEASAHVNVSSPINDGAQRTYTIRSTGNIGNKSRTVKKEITVNWIDTSTGGGGVPNVPPGAAIIAKNNIDFKGGSINGDVYLDSSEQKSFSLYNSGLTAPNNIYTSYPNALENMYQVEGDNNNTILNRFLDNTEYSNINFDWNLTEIDMPNYNNFPSLLNDTIIENDSEQYEVIKNGNIYMDHYLTNDYILNLEKENYKVNSLSFASNYKMKVNTNNKDVNLVVRDLDIAQGHIEIIGDGTLNLYVLGDLNITGSINGNDDFSKFNLYYYGDEKMMLSGASSVNGGIYIDKASLELTGAGNITGPILMNGSKVEINGGSTNNIFIMAPKANVTLKGGGTLTGAVVSDEITLEGGANIEYGPYNFDDYPFGTFPSEIPNYNIDDLVSSKPAIEP